MATAILQPAAALRKPGGNRMPADSPWAKYVWVDSERVSGEPCFRDTRVPIRILFDHLRDGPLEEFLDGVEDVTLEQVHGVMDLVADETIERLKRLQSKS
jgi:uncharacterized protein (DUF433 family)